MNQPAYRCSILFICLLCAATIAKAQQSRKLIAGGNQLYQAGKYKEAALLYNQALKADTANLTKGAYNLGNALYQQKQPEAARKAYEAAAKKTTDKKENAGAEYNVGNTYMQEKKWEDAIEAYKKTLRNNPQDADAKYNLSYAKTMLKKEGGGGKGKDQDKNKDQDKKDQDKKDENKDQKDKQDQGQPKEDPKDPKEDQQQQAQPQPSKLSEKQAEQLLNALQQEEKKLQDKNKKMHGVPVKMEKDW